MTIGVLASYALDSKPKATGDRVAELLAAGVPFVWDSGGWSVFTGAAEVDRITHAEWVVSSLDTMPGARFVGLDVIGDPDATLDNYRVQRSIAPVEPTFHYGTDFSYLDRILEVGVDGWLNIGGMVGALRSKAEHRNIAAFIAAVRRRVPDEVQLHALGCTPPNVARMVHFDAADSTYWLTPVMPFRSLGLFDERAGDWRRFGVKSTAGPAEWSIAHRAGRWLRGTYGVEPGDLAQPNNDRRLLGLSIESHARFARWAGDRHGRPVTIYLAGALSHTIARSVLLDQHRQPQEATA